MNVFGYSTDGPFDASDHQTPWKKPYPTGRFGIKARLAGGDVCWPVLRRRVAGATGKRDWFNTLPALLLKVAVAWPCLPFVSIGIGRFGFYIGFKVYGVDLEWYRKWLRDEEVYIGSNALHPTMRFTMARMP